MIVEGVDGGFRRRGYKRGVDRPHLREDIQFCGVAIMISSINMVCGIETRSQCFFRDGSVALLKKTTSTAE